MTTPRSPKYMTHRTDMTAVEDTSSISEAVNLSIENGYSRIPVYHEDLDDIVGIVYVKDLFKNMFVPKCRRKPSLPT